MKYTDERCPSCRSPDPKLHPAVQWEGEVQVCKNPWHGQSAPRELTFAALREVDMERCNTAFGPTNKLMDWSPCEWATALAGEVGEACNLIKKHRHGDRVLVLDIAKELADVVIYADLLAARFDIDLGAAIVQKFNEVSRRIGSPIMLPTPDLPNPEDPPRWSARAPSGAGGKEDGGG